VLFIDALRFCLAVEGPHGVTPSTIFMAVSLFQLSFWLPEVNQPIERMYLSPHILGDCHLSVSVNFSEQNCLSGQLSGSRDVCLLKHSPILLSTILKESNTDTEILINRGHQAVSSLNSIDAGVHVFIGKGFISTTWIAWVLSLLYLS
jgi:hypothetical protein